MAHARRVHGACAVRVWHGLVGTALREERALKRRISAVGLMRMPPAEFVRRGSLVHVLVSAVSLVVVAFAPISNR
jgi:hypothetical protein